MKFRKGDVVLHEVYGECRVKEVWPNGTTVCQPSIWPKVNILPEYLTLIYRPHLSTREAERWVTEHSPDVNVFNRSTGMWVAEWWWMIDDAMPIACDGKSLRSAVNKLRRKLRAAGVEVE